MFYACIPRSIPFLPVRRRHDTPAGRAGRKRRPEIRPLDFRGRRKPAGGAPGGAAPGRQASQTCRMRRARLAGGPRKPIRSARETGASQAPERGLANPWRLPALHSFGNGKRARRTRRPSKQYGRRSVGYGSFAVRAFPTLSSSAKADDPVNAGENVWQGRANTSISVITGSSAFADDDNEEPDDDNEEPDDDSEEPDDDSEEADDDTEAIALQAFGLSAFGKKSCCPLIL
jgi:hypothetical protein